MCRKFFLVISLVGGIFSTEAAFETVNSSIVFFKGIARNPRRVGAFFPSSSSVAQELIKPMQALAEDSRVLEVGAGTGQITGTIIPHLGTHTLDVVELDTDYCTTLHKRFGSHERVNIVCGSILDFKPDYQYDAIICTLPFNSFELSLTKSLIEHLLTLIKPGGAFSYIELHGVTDIGKVLLPAQKKQQLQATLHYMHAFRDRYVKRSITVLYNIPPMYVHHGVIA